MNGTHMRDAVDPKGHQGQEAKPLCSLRPANPLPLECNRMNDSAVAKLQDVFGVSRDVPLTYVERDDVDKKSVSSLAREKHIVVYGGSKQGKTSLRKHALPESDYAVVQCTGTTSRIDIYSMILKPRALGSIRLRSVRRRPMPRQESQ
jgi:hypothetical protein